MDANASLETLRPQVKAILERAIEERAFPGAVVHLEWRGQVMRAQRGQRGYEAPFEMRATERTVYDLASLTKLWTLAAAMLSMRQRRLRPDTPLFVLLPQFDVPDKRAITLRHLMMHSSGIEFALQNLAQGAPLPREEWVPHIVAAPLASEPGERALYSCANYFLLARALDMSAFDSTLQALIFDGRYFHAHNAALTLHPAGLPSRFIAPTEADAETGKYLRGVVHDEAARAWSGGKYFSFAGNAGLFGDIDAVAGFVRLWLRDGIFFPGDAERALSDTLPEGSEGARRGWGWQIDAPSLIGRTGTDAPLGAFGHSGFTGPALWAHRATQSACIVLCNRVHPTRRGPDRMLFVRQISSLMGGFLREHDAENFHISNP